jgi:hypothetical protein
MGRVKCVTVKCPKLASKNKCTDVSAKGTGTLMTVDKKIGGFGRVCQKCSCWKEFSYQ